jgi:hypothetical protein
MTISFQVSDDYVSTYLKGARFGIPSGERDDTNAIGRGINALVRMRYATLEASECLLSKSRDVTYLLGVSDKSQVFHPASSSFFHGLAPIPSPAPRPIFHDGSGGSVTRKGGLVKGGNRVSEP